TPSTLASLWQSLRVLLLPRLVQQPSRDRYMLTAPGTGRGGSVVLAAPQVGELPCPALSRSLLPTRRLPRSKWGIWSVGSVPNSSLLISFPGQPAQPETWT